MVHAVTMSLLLTVPALSLKNVACDAFRAEEGVSELFKAEVFFSSNHDLSPNAVAGKPAWLNFANLGQTGAFAGVVLEFRVLNKTDVNSYSYALVIGPRLALLDRTQQSEIFAADTALGVKDLVHGVLDDTLSHSSTATGHGIKLDFTMHASLPQEFQRSHITKYNESDFRFLSRICEHYGIFYFFDFEEGSSEVKDHVTFAADNAAFRLRDERVLRFAPHRTSAISTDEPAIHSLEHIVTPSFQQFGLRDFNEEKPGSGLLVQTEKSEGIGSVVEYGHHYPDEVEGHKLVAMRAEEAAWQNSVFKGESTAPWLSAGTVFNIETHPISSFKGEYVVITISHEGGTPGPLGHGYGHEPIPYRNSFTAIKKSQAFRPRRVTPRPVMSGVFNALVDAEGSDSARAELDNSGRYRIKLRYNEGASNGKDGKSSVPVRQAQPYAGASANGVVSGLHFPLVKNAEVLVGYVNGNPDRPVILGATHNGSNANPVTNKHNTVNRLRTTGGLLMELDDGKTDVDSRFIRFDVPAKVTDTPPTGTYLRLGAFVAGDEKVQTGLTYTTSEVSVTKNTNVWKMGGSLSPTLDNVASASVKTTNRSSGDGFILYTEKDLEINVERAGLMRFGAGYSSEVTKGDSTNKVKNGQYILQAKNGITLSANETAADINITAKNQVNIKANGDKTDFVGGFATKYSMGNSFTFFAGAEETIKVSISFTLQLSSVISLNLGHSVGFTLFNKSDYILGNSTKITAGDLKVVWNDKKIVTTDMKIGSTDTKLVVTDFKKCEFNITVETTTNRDYKTALTTALVDTNKSKITAHQKGTYAKYVDLETIM